MWRCLWIQGQLPSAIVHAGVTAAGLALAGGYAARRVLRLHPRPESVFIVGQAAFGVLFLQDRLVKMADCCARFPLLDTAVARDMRGMLRERYPSSAWVKAVSEYAGDQPGPSAGDRWLGSPAPFIRVWQSWLGYWQPADAAFRDDHAAPDDHLGLSGDQQRIAAAFARASAPAPPSADHSSLPALAAAPSPHAAAAVMPSPPAAAATSAASAAAGSHPRPSLPGARRPAGSEQDAEADEFSLQDADGQRREGGAGRWKDEDERRRRREARWQVQRAREAGTAAAQPPPASAGARPHPPAPPPFTAAARPDRPDRSRPPRVRRNEFGDEIVEDE